MKFKSGDIIRGTEGDGKTWGNTTTLLLLHVRNDNHACAVVLQSFNPVSGKVHACAGDFGNWGLNSRDWENIGVDSHLELLDHIIASHVAQYAAQ